MKTNCKNCGKELTRIPSRAKGNCYCNNKCQMEYEYRTGIRNPQKITEKAHKMLRIKGHYKRNNTYLIGETNPAKTIKARKKNSESKIGRKNPNWKENKAPKREPWNWLKKQVKERDNFECKICGYEKKLEVHHIKPWKDRGKHEMNNLITLCHDCHWKMHKLIREKKFDLYKKELKERGMYVAYE